jgi:integrase
MERVVTLAMKAAVSVDQRKSRKRAQRTRERGVGQCVGEGRRAFALDHFQRIVDPDRLVKLTPQVMSRSQAEARKEGMKATTPARHLRHIKAFPMVHHKTNRPLDPRDVIGRTITAIGRKAGVVVGETEKLVDENGKRGKRPVKLFAGAHDLRRAFCSHWARNVMPAVLQKLARHSHISTTMAFYVSLSPNVSDLCQVFTLGLRSGVSSLAIRNLTRI